MRRRGSRRGRRASVSGDARNRSASLHPGIPKPVALIISDTIPSSDRANRHVEKGEISPSLSRHRGARPSRPPSHAGILRSPMTDTRSHLTTALSDRYRIERELGAGGMATVYLAEDLKHDRKVAIKVLSPSSPP